MSALPSAVQNKANEANSLIEQQRLESAGSQTPAPTDATVPRGTDESASVEPSPVSPEAAIAPAGSVTPDLQVPASPDAVQPSVLNGDAETGAPPIQMPGNLGIDLSTATKAQLTQFIGQQAERFQALQGKYQSEVPRLISMNKTLRDDIAARDDEIQRLQQAGHTQSAQPSNGPDPQWADRFRRDDPTYRDMAEYDPDKAEEYLQRTAAAQIPENPPSEIPQQPPAAAPEQSGGDLRNQTDLVQELREHLDIFLGPGIFDGMVNNHSFDAWLNEADPVLGGSRKENMHRLAHQRNFVGAGEYWKQWALQNRFAATAKPADPREQLVEPSSSAGADAPPVDPREGYVTAEEYQEHTNRWSADSHYRNSDVGRANREKFDAAINQGKLGY